MSTRHATESVPSPAKDAGTEREGNGGSIISGTPISATPRLKFDGHDVELTEGALRDWLDQVRREAKNEALQPFLEMSEEMGQAIAFDVLTTPHGEAEYPVSYFREQLDKAIGQAEDQLEQEGKNDGEER